MNNLSSRLLLALEKSGKSKTDIWQACGISSGAVSHWFKGNTKTIKGQNLTRTAAVLGVNPSWLSEGIGPMQNSISIADVTTTASHASVTTTHAAEPDPILADLAMLTPLAIEEFRLAIKYAADLQRARQRAAQASQQAGDVDKELKNQTPDPPQGARRAA